VPCWQGNSYVTIAAVQANAAAGCLVGYSVFKLWHLTDSGSQQPAHQQCCASTLCFSFVQQVTALVRVPACVLLLLSGSGLLLVLCAWGCLTHGAACLGTCVVLRQHMLSCEAQLQAFGCICMCAVFLFLVCCAQPADSRYDALL
jgi:hypothetical protein